ncbi:MAG TPA: Dabb family protein [Streptosporangiaceae bacterium]|nr:Dabb family protein [Streptosporangiaceae bacterium]
MLTHLVLFRLRRPSDGAARMRLIDALTAFAAQAPFAEGPATVLADLGLRDANPHGCDALLRVRFGGTEAFASYLTSQPHQTLVSEVLEPSCESWWSIQTSD